MDLNDLENERDQPTIVGGNAASPGEYPHQISLQTRSGFHFCGGSLIGDNWVLTAAHCVDGSSASSMQVEVGVHRLSQGGEVFAVSQAIMHPNYRASTNDYDMALLRLSRSAAGYPKIPLVDPDSASVAAPGTMATVTGWGTLSSGGSSPDVLMEVDVPILSNAQCDAAYRNENITDRMLCAGFLGTGGADSCQGDSGGPLVVDTSNGLAQAGVVSWGYGCADPDHPGVYARVSTLASWVASHVPDVAFVSDGGDPGPGPGPNPDPEPPAPSTDDHGNDIASATVVSGSASVAGVIDAGDVDVFRIELNGATELALSSTGTTDTFGTLYSSTGAQITANDDDGPGTNFALSLTATEDVYYLAVRGYSGTTTGAYTLVVEATGSTPTPTPPPAPVGDDHGDDQASATAVPLNVTAQDASVSIVAQLDAGDTDVFRLEVANNSGITDPILLTAGTTGSTDTYGTLYDSAGTVVDQNDDTTGLNFQVSAEVQPGVYFLHVRGYSTSTNGAYTLGITAAL
ncbi:MAG: serine protease [Alphaproteobacteria bacterium]|nr:serine protease [Alphaproteobacteria bacterium]